MLRARYAGISQFLSARSTSHSPVLSWNDITRFWLDVQEVGKFGRPFRLSHSVAAPIKSKGGATTRTGISSPALFFAVCIISWVLWVLFLSPLHRLPQRQEYPEYPSSVSSREGEPCLTPARIPARRQRAPNRRHRARGPAARRRSSAHQA